MEDYCGAFALFRGFAVNKFRGDLSLFDVDPDRMITVLRDAHDATVLREPGLNGVARGKRAISVSA